MSYLFSDLLWLLATTMILSTTPTIEGKSITRYCGVIGTEVIFGAFFMKDWIAEATDTWGGRNEVYEKVFGDARVKAQQELGIKAENLRADAIVNIRFAYQVLGDKNGMMMVAATGTAVALELNKEERALLEQAQAKHAAKEAAQYFVQIGDKQRGPFSIIQLRELIASGKISSDTTTKTETGISGPSVGQLVD